MALLKNFVNETWVKYIDMDDIQLIDKAFVPKDFQEREADIIYRCKINGCAVFFSYCLSCNPQLTIQCRFG